MKTIYRIENRNQIGMYHSGAFRSVVGPDDKARHPEPKDNGLLAELFIKRNIRSFNDYHFGFSSIEQLRNWLYEDKWLVGMHELGLVISEYQCNDEDVLIGHTQAMFRNKVCRLEFSILDYFKLI